MDIKDAKDILNQHAGAPARLEIAKEWAKAHPLKMVKELKKYMKRNYRYGPSNKTACAVMKEAREAHLKLHPPKPKRKKLKATRKRSTKVRVVNSRQPSWIPSAAMLTTLNRSANALERIADTFESLVKEWSTSIRILPAAMTLNEEIQDLVKSPEIVKES